MNILWAGPLQSEEGLLNGTAPHPATMRWQRMFVGGLREAGNRVRWIGHEPHRTWPWGPLRVLAADRSKTSAIDPHARQIPYLNVSRLRDSSLARAYRDATTSAIGEERPDVIVTYNADPWSRGVAKAAARAGVPWVPLILDHRDPLHDDWRSFRAETQTARGVAFISHWAFEHAPVASKHLLAGAVVPREAVVSPPRSADRSLLLYAGSHAPAGGLNRLVAAMPLLKTAGVRLVVTGQGKGLYHEISQACLNTPGVEDLGMVSEERLADLAAAADVLVNPRPIDFENNRINFPSKLLDYLSYGKPIVSTRTAGIGPGYDDIVHFTASDEPADIAAGIDAVLAMPSQERTAWMQRIADAGDRLTPKRAAADLVQWIRGIDAMTTPVRG